MSGRVEVTDRAASGVDRAWIRQLVGGVLDGEGRRGPVHVVLVADEEMRELNRRYHHEDAPTDVLSFAAAPPDENESVWDPAGESPAAEIVVSVETARREASRRGLAPDAELALYLVHGVLHVLGYDDLEGAARARMRQAEARHLDEAGYPGDLHAARRREEEDQ